MERQGWLTYYDTAKPRGERRFFIMRGVNLTCFESEVMEDSGVRVACLNKSQISYTEPRAICLAGDWYSIRAGFVWDSESRSLSFECEDVADARAWVALAITKEGATAGQAPIDAQEHTGTTPQQPHQNGGTSLRARPPVPAYPHESEYGGGKDYVSAPYNGGKSILEPEVCESALALPSSVLPVCQILIPLRPRHRHRVHRHRAADALTHAPRFALQQYQKARWAGVRHVDVDGRGFEPCCRLCLEPRRKTSGDAGRLARCLQTRKFWAQTRTSCHMQQMRGSK